MGLRTPTAGQAIRLSRRDPGTAAWPALALA